MQVDATTLAFINAKRLMNKKKPSTTGPRKPTPTPNKKNVKSSPSAPPPYRSTPSSSTSASKPKPKTPFYCFLCNGEGHYARNCKAQINNLELDHLRDMAVLFEDTLDYHSQFDESEASPGQQEEFEQEESVEEQEEEESLIDFEEAGPSTDDNDNPFGQH